MNYTKQLRSQGYRLTPQRQIIFDVMRENIGHLTIAQIYELVQDISTAIDRATVYRTLNLFQELGLVHSSRIAGQIVFEFMGEEPHHHLVCNHCGSVHHLDHYHFEKLVNHLYTEHQFVAQMNHLTISGLCGECWEEDQKAAVS